MNAPRAPIAEAQFRLLLASVKDYAIFMLDPGGHVASWNAGAQTIKGYRPEEAIGKHMSVFYTPEDLASGRPAQLLELAVATGRVEDEGWRVRKDGTRFWADVVITTITDDAGQPQGFAKVTRDLTSRRAAAEELRQSEERLAATLYSVGDGVLATDERARPLLTGSSKTTRGESARTAPASGPTWCSARSGTRAARSSATPGSPATSPNAGGWKKSASGWRRRRKRFGSETSFCRSHPTS